VRRTEPWPQGTGSCDSVKGIDMRRNHTLRALAAGAGAAAVLMAAASPALALENPPFYDSWQEGLVEQGYSDVSCTHSPLQGNQSAVFFDEDDWGGYLEGDNEWLLVVLKVANDQEGFAWTGYGEDNVYEPERE